MRTIQTITRRLRVMVAGAVIAASLTAAGTANAFPTNPGSPTAVAFPTNPG